MAKECRLAINTMKIALPHLISGNVLSKDKRTGQFSIVRLNAADEWWTEPRPKDYLGSKTAYPQPKRHPNHLAQTAPYEGNPSKVIP
jgi:hypothetical protein